MKPCALLLYLAEGLALTHLRPKPERRSARDVESTVPWSLFLPSVFPSPSYRRMFEHMPDCLKKIIKKLFEYDR